MSGCAVRCTSASGATGPPPGAVAGVSSATSKRAVRSAAPSVPAVPATWTYSLPAQQGFLDTIAREIDRSLSRRCTSRTSSD
eukprot:5336798-Prymnesium_polylepis.1